VLTGVGTAQERKEEGMESLIHPPASLGLKYGEVVVVPELAAASETDKFTYAFKRRFYAGIGVGLSKLSPDLSMAPSLSLVEDGGESSQLTLGLDVSRHFSVELHATTLNEIEFSSGGLIDYENAGASALLYLGRSESKKTRQGLLGFIRVGYGALSTDEIESTGIPISVENSSALLLGAGLEYAFNKQLSLRAEYISFQEDIDYAQLGLIYRFGTPKKIKTSRQAEVAANAELLSQEAKVNESTTTQPNVVPLEPTLVLEIPEPQLFTAPESEESVAQQIAQCGMIAGEIERVNFAFDSARISRAAQQTLEQAALALINCGTERIMVQGHTDSIGTINYNQNLSEKRADSVIRYFESIGMRVEQFQEDSFGERRPIDSNETVDGRAANRRVELFVK